MNPKALWTRIHKFSPNLENFFNNTNKINISSVVEYLDDSELSLSNSDISSDDSFDKYHIYTIFISAEK